MRAVKLHKTALQQRAPRQKARRAPHTLGPARPSLIATTSAELTPAMILTLQRLAGNGAVSTLLRQQVGVPWIQRCGGTAHPGCACATEDEIADPTLRLGQPGDRFEQEADAVAERIVTEPTVMRKAVDGSCSSAPADDDPQAIEEEVPMVMARAAGTDLGRLTPRRADAVRSRLGQGAPLSAQTLAFMQPRFGRDFGQVRIHTDAEAHQLSRQLRAEAFTTGTDIFFQSGRYEPETLPGRKLLAHELTHVVQQTGGAAARAIQRYTLDKFPPTEQAMMMAAIPTALSTIKSCKPNATCVASAIDGSTYKYAAEQQECGWTYPTSSTIWIGPSAFDPDTCCLLASTIAHEASHTCFYTEGAARKLECACFNCSCGYGG